jgi:flagellar basal body L-ring protein FlgH
MHSVITDEEETTITLTGVCRSKDVGADNTILSTQLARLDVQKHHRGTARDATKPGLLGGLLDWLTLF